MPHGVFTSKIIGVNEPQTEHDLRGRVPLLRATIDKSGKGVDLETGGKLS